MRRTGCSDSWGSAASFRIVLGEHSQTTSEGTEVEIEVGRVVVHDRYDPDTTDFDIALLYIDAPLKLSCNVRPICLPSEDCEINTLCVATGWGTQTSGWSPAGIHRIFEVRLELFGPLPPPPLQYKCPRGTASKAHEHKVCLRYR